MAKNNGPTLETLAIELENSFRRWDTLYTQGGSDPFHSDGVNLNLVRNHILSYKRQMEELMARENETLTLFGSSYPDIYYRETPEQVPYDYMAKAEEIRARANEQMALYEKDPNFCFIRDHHHEIFPKGETKATRAAGLSPYKSSSVLACQQVIEQDDLVRMRSYFYRPYEEKAPEWAATAKQLKAYLEADHSMDDNTQIQDLYMDEDCDIECLQDEAESIENKDKAGETTLPPQPVKPSLDALIEGAKAKAQPAHKHEPSREDQLSFF